MLSECHEDVTFQEITFRALVLKWIVFPAIAPEVDILLNMTSTW